MTYALPFALHMIGLPSTPILKSTEDKKFRWETSITLRSLASEMSKKVTLTNVLHVLKMSMNLVSGDLLRKLRIKFVYESGKLILTCNGVFVGTGYYSEGMVKLCIIDNVINETFPSAHMLDLVSLWHNRLAHIGISTMKRLIKCGLISYKFGMFDKCEICVKSKMIKRKLFLYCREKF